jgi:hypothetical protein
MRNKGLLPLMRLFLSGNHLNFGLCVEGKRFLSKEMSSWGENFVDKELFFMKE